MTIRVFGLNSVPLKETTTNGLNRGHSILALYLDEAPRAKCSLDKLELHGPDRKSSFPATLAPIASWNIPQTGVSILCLSLMSCQREFAPDPVMSSDFVARPVAVLRKKNVEPSSPLLKILAFFSVFLGKPGFPR